MYKHNTSVISNVCEYEIKNGSLSMMHINTANLSYAYSIPGSTCTALFDTDQSELS